MLKCAFYLKCCLVFLEDFTIKKIYTLQYYMMQEKYQVISK